MNVYLIAETMTLPIDLHNWIASIGGNEVFEHLSGTEPERLIELAARRCYRSYAAGLNKNVKKVRTNSKEYHANILQSRHGSVLEHASATFAFEKVSRVFTHELVRHRAGTAYSQESLRYVRLSDELDVWIPPEIAANETARAVFYHATRASF